MLQNHKYNSKEQPCRVSIFQDATWEKVKNQFVHAIVTTKAGFKETEILNLLILKGIEHITDEDYIRAAAQKQK